MQVFDCWLPLDLRHAWMSFWIGTSHLYMSVFLLQNLETSHILLNLRLKSDLSERDKESFCKLIQGIVPVRRNLEIISQQIWSWISHWRSCHITQVVGSLHNCWYNHKHFPHYSHSHSRVPCSWISDKCDLTLLAIAVFLLSQCGLCRLQDNRESMHFMQQKIKVYRRPCLTARSVGKRMQGVIRW